MCGMFERSNNDGKSSSQGGSIYISWDSQIRSYLFELPSALVNSTWR